MEVLENTQKTQSLYSVLNYIDLWTMQIIVIVLQNR